MDHSWNAEVILKMNPAMEKDRKNWYFGRLAACTATKNSCWANKNLNSDETIFSFVWFWDILE